MAITVRTLAPLALMLSIAAGSAEAVLVSTFGRGDTPASAVDAGKRQAVKDALDMLVASPGQDVAASMPRVGRVRVIRTAKIAPALYEAELEADVSLGPGLAHHRPRAAFVVDPYSTDDGTAVSVLDEAVGRLRASAALDVVSGDSGVAGRLFDRVRSGAGRVRPEQRNKEAADAFDLLFVVAVTPASTARPAAGADRQARRTQVAVIDAATEDVISVSAIKPAFGTVSPDSRAVFIRDAGRQVAGIAEKLTRPMQQHSPLSRVIRIATGGVSLTVGQRVSIFRAADAHPNKQLPARRAGTGEVIAAGPDSIEVLADRPLSQQRRYVVRPIHMAKRSGIRNGVSEVISEGDW